MTAVSPAFAQTPTPTPTPPRIDQDEIDLVGRANVVQGSGARALGMGGAFLARADDATAASWNPAGLSYLRRPEFSLVGAHSEYHTFVATPAGEPRPFEDRQRGLTPDLARGHVTPDFAAVTLPVSLGPTTGAVQISVQRILSFAGQREILTPNGSVPRVSIDASGGFDVLAAGAGLRVTRTLRLGATLNRWYNGFDQVVYRQRAVPARLEVDFGFSGWNANLGAMWTPVQSLNLGAVYKTPFTGHIDLRRSRTDYYPTGAQANSFDSDDLDASDGPVRLEFPAAFGVGLSWRPRSNLTLSSDVTRTRWSTARVRNFYTLRPATPAGVAPVPTAPEDLFDSLAFPAVEDARQADTTQVRMGVEYVILAHRLRIPVRAGYIDDGQYFYARDGAPHFHGFTAGAGVIVGPVLLDAAFLHERGSYHAAGNPFRLRANRVFMSLIYRYQERGNGS